MSRSRPGLDDLGHRIGRGAAIGAGFLLLMAFTRPASAQAPRAPDLRFSPPKTLATLDMHDMAGEPSRVAWSPDGTQLYVQTLEGGFGKPEAVPRHHVFDAASGARETLQVEPDWAVAYWAAKSGQRSPDDPPLKIELRTEARKERTTSLPQGGELARGGTTPAITENDQLSILAQQSVALITLLLNGEVVGRFENTVLVPGYTYGWGPMGAKIMAYAALKTGRVTIMDDAGRKNEVAGSRDAILPAWSPDGDRIAWLQKAGRRRFLLQVTHVSVG